MDIARDENSDGKLFEGETLEFTVNTENLDNQLAQAVII